MDASVLQHLHSVTLRTLQSHSFNRSSSIAAHTLTDVLCRYLLLLVSTAKANAEHSGRDAAGVNAVDVLNAMEDIGVGLDELKEYLELEASGMAHLAIERTPVPLETVDPDDEKAMADAIAAARRIDSLVDIKGNESAINRVASLTYHCYSFDHGGTHARPRLYASDVPTRPVTSATLTSLTLLVPHLR